MDISQRKVSSCQESFSEVPNLSFERFNANNETHRREFLEKWRNKVSLVTIFSSGVTTDQQYSAKGVSDAPSCVKMPYPNIFSVSIPAWAPFLMIASMVTRSSRKRTTSTMLQPVSNSSQKSSGMEANSLPLCHFSQAKLTHLQG